MSNNITMKKKTLEDYLKIIYILALDRKKIENEDLALILGTEYSKVKKNINELLKKGYITYDNRKLSLTDKGLDVANEVYKKHELFEDFLKKILKISHIEAHKFSEILEHISSDEIETKINQLLEEYNSTNRIVPLTFLKNGQSGKLVRIEGGYGLTSRLYELGVCGNCEIKVLEGGSARGPIKIKVRESELMLGYGQARRIFVEEEKIKGDNKEKK